MMTLGQHASHFISNHAQQQITAELKKESELSDAVITRGVAQAAKLWNKSDGSEKEFVQFCKQYFCKTKEEKQQLFNRIEQNFELIFGHNNFVTVNLMRPIHVRGYEQEPVDELFASYDLNAHFNDDMFNTKIAFVVALNFPSFTLHEKQASGSNWSNQEWGYVRLGDIFASRVDASVLQGISSATANADNYISNYNIPMGKVSSLKRKQYWDHNTNLISHWGLRDELKSAYSDKENGLDKQKTIYSIMLRIIEQTVPQEVFDNTYEKGVWFPGDNTIEINAVEVPTSARKNERYQHLLAIFNAMKAADPYYSKSMDNYMKRKFDGEFEIAMKDAEKLFTTLMQSAQVEEVAKIIEKRLGRKLRPFDIWYDGFKNRSSMDASYLDSLTKAKYPTRDALQEGLVDLLVQLNFDRKRAEEICQYIHVDPSVGAGHAWGAQMKGDKALLRTRIGDDGLDYKGYNIGVHEFGHNVEQVISLHDVDNYFLAGVPNTAFTEALAFVFQSKDLPLLGVENTDTMAHYLKTLDLFWGCYEIMGVSLVDMKVWQWMYDHPQATANQLQAAYISIAKEVWNTYYAPVFKEEDVPILAIYSHSIDAPLYLSAYPLGHVIEFQLETYLKGKNLGTEVDRIFSLGRLTPNAWMQKAVGSDISVTPLLNATSQSVKVVNNAMKGQKKRR